MAIASPAPRQRARLADTMAEVDDDEPLPNKRSLEDSEAGTARKKSKPAPDTPAGGIQEEAGEDPFRQLAQMPAVPSTQDDESAGASVPVAASQPLVRGGTRRRDDSATPQTQTATRNEGHFQPVEAGNGRGHAGQIKRLVLENFMCHEHIAVDFIPRMNFICGQNGSGKTAVLHGLQTCLGVTARQSGRASTALEFIRDGANHCKASVTLWNTGEDAYLPRRFGPTVTVTRELRRTAKNGTTSSWLIEDANGKKVGSKKAEVDELLRSLNVNAANPIVCLTQDTARSFGGGREAQERYRVFMEATQFNVIIEHLKMAESEVDTMRARRKDVRKLIKERQEQLQAVLQKLGNMEEMKVWEEQQRDLQNWIAWEHALEPLQKAQESRDKLDNQASQRMNAFLESLAEAEAKLQQAQEKHQAQGSAIEDFPQRMEALQEEHRVQQQLYQNARKANLKVAKVLSSRKGELQEKETEVAGLEEAIAEVQAQMEETARGEEEATAAALRQKLVEAQAADAEAIAARQEIRVAQTAVTEAADAARAADSSYKNAKAQVEDAQTAISRLQGQQRGNAVEMFAPPGAGPAIGKLIARIERAASEGKFQRKPLGPLGSLLTLTDDKWALAVEASIGKNLNDIIVHSHRDAQLVKQLARGIQNCPQPGLIIYSFDHQAYDLRAGRNRQVDENLPTVFRVLRVQPGPHAHIVSNVLLDTCSAERLLLVEDEAAGMRAIRGSLSQQGVINSAWDKFGWHGFRRRNNLTSVPLPQGRRIHARLRKDVAGAVQEVRDELRELQTALSQQQRNLEAARQAERLAKQGLEAAKRAANRMSQRKTDLDSQVAELRTQHMTQTRADESSAEELALQLAEAQRAVASLQAEVDAMQQEADAVKAEEAAEGRKMKDKKQEMDRQIRMNENEISAQHASLTKVQDAEAQKQQVEDTIAKLKEVIGRLEATEKEYRAKYEQNLVKARQTCAEAEFEASRAQLEAEMEKRRKTAARNSQEASDLELMAKWLTELEQKIAARERQVGASRDELEEAKDVHETWLAKRNDEAAVLDHNYVLFSESYRLRREAARRMRKNTLAAIERSFNTYLHQRGFTGSMAINMETHTLHLKVKMDKSAAQAVDDMKSLSGGERSFTNMCFVMAVGQDISSPFHCLDEFDVFMDAVNRKIAIEALMKFGAMQEHLQLLLLTPQATHVIEDAKQNVRKALKGAYPGDDFVLAKAMEAPRPRAGASQRR